MPTSREMLTILAALLTAGAAVHVLVDDMTAARVGWTTHTWDGWATAPSTGLVIGAVATVLGCIAVSMRGSQRGGWDDVALLGAVIVVVYLAPRAVAGDWFLTVTHLLGCVAAGAMLGAGVAVSWGRVVWQAALTAGVVTAVVAAPLRARWGYVVFDEKNGSVAPNFDPTDPNWWVLGAAIVAAIGAAAFAQSGVRMRRPDRRIAVISVGGVAVLAVANRQLSEWVYRAESWWVVAVALVVIMGATIAVAAVTERQFVLVALAVAASVTIVVRDLRAAPASVSVPWLLLVAVLAVVLGMWGSHVRRDVLLGLAVVAIVPLVSVVEPGFGTDGIVSVLRVAVVAVAAGYALGSSFPRQSAIAVPGFAVLFASSVLTAAAVPLQPARRINFAYVGDDVGGLPFGDTNSYRLAAFAMLLVVAACAGAVVLLRRRSALMSGSTR